MPSSVVLLKKLLKKSIKPYGAPEIAKSDNQLDHLHKSVPQLSALHKVYHHEKGHVLQHLVPTRVGLLHQNKNPEITSAYSQGSMHSACS
jgi:hypothetical protein